MLSETITNANKVLKLTMNLPPSCYIKLPIVNLIMPVERKDQLSKGLKVPYP